ncbi:MAG: RagB/SusD family nutrient uptake outer membrane protein, partial [Odoribacter sp.]|nr:RagB/SusD family nutrient uptake outer membrane protein [Odoribacter sp.]
MKKYISVLCILIFFGCDCRLDVMRSHNLSDASTYLKKFENVVNATSGLYALFYGKVGGFNYDYIYEVVYHTLGEFRGNNVVFAEPFEGTSDVALGAPDAHFYLYSDQKDQSFAWPMWIKMNQIVLGASKNIEAIKLLEKEPTEQFRLDELKRLKGENYFIRGLLLFHAVNAFGLPYWNEPDKNPGVPLDTTGSGQLLPRSSVKECYESIIRDFNNAASCLPDEKMDRSFANRAAAYGMLSRVYLYMGGRPDAPNVDYNKLAITYANKVFEIQNDVVD